MTTPDPNIDARPSLTSTNKCELLLFRLDRSAADRSSGPCGVNVFKVCETVRMPAETPMAGAAARSAGVAHPSEQMGPVHDLPGAVGCRLEAEPGQTIAAEYERSTQAFVVESVEDIVRLDWSRVIPVEASGSSLTTGVATAWPQDG